MRTLLLVGAIMVVSTNPVHAQAPPAANEDEEKIPPYILPDPLIANDGSKVTTPDEWNQKRRGELLQLFTQEMYGISPPKPADLSFRVLDVDKKALAGKAIRKVVRVNMSAKPGSPYMGIHIYSPANATGPVPLFVGLHLFDKSALVPAPGARILPEGRQIPPDIDPALLPGPDTINRILERGYAIATINPEDIAPDDAKAFLNGVIKMHWRPNQTERAPNDWGAIAAWSWGLSRALDYFETDPDYDAKKIIAIGHSRRGKAALWAAVNDVRFAAVISNQSGCGGAALSKRKFGETVALINNRFPHWFCENFKKYNNKEENLPFDQHELIALLAPRPVYIGSAEQDKWADPKGEFLSALFAGPVYQLLGQQGLGVTEFPPINTSIGQQIGYHCRTGVHALADMDWMLYLNWTDRVVGHKSG